MQQVMNEIYNKVAIEAIASGFDGSWERVIAERLYIDYLKDHSECCEIVGSIKIFSSLKNACQKAAYLITSSKIPSEDTADIGID
jgi:hypothetical protein